MAMLLLKASVVLVGSAHGCNAINGINFPGNNIGGASDLKMDSFGDCCNVCSHIKGATHGIYCTGEISGHCAAKTCWCKSGANYLTQTGVAATSFSVSSAADLTDPGNVSLVSVV